MSTSNLSFPAGSPAAVPRLKPVLGLKDLVIYGIVAITPSAPVSIFGIVMVSSIGHAIDTLLLAMVAMIFTAISYGRMATLYPSAGSAYAYVGRGLHPHMGFLAGWAMVLDYVLIPVFCVIYGTLAFQRLIPEVPFIVWSALFAGIITLANLRGIKTTARTNEILVGAMGVVLLMFIGFAVRYLFARDGIDGVISSIPFYNPETFDFRAIATTTSFAALTYLGFDSVTTLAEDVKNPKRNVMLAAVLVILFTGFFGSLLIYLGQLVWPDYNTFPKVETAFMDVTQRVGGRALFVAMAVLLIVAHLGAMLAVQAGAARLLFGMGRDNVFPRRVFARLDAKGTPSYNLWIVGLLAFVGAQFLDMKLTGSLLNFGAFLGFMGVNVAAIWQFFVRPQVGRKRNFFLDLVLPGLGFVFCLGIWIGLPREAMMAGGAWFAVGIGYLLIRTRGFKIKPAPIDFSAS